MVISQVQKGMSLVLWYSHISFSIINVYIKRTRGSFLVFCLSWPKHLGQQYSSRHGLFPPQPRGDRSESIARQGAGADDLFALP